MPKNKLTYEKSLYLQSHADDPVDWFPWGTEALQRSRNEQKPIFLSIGYSACHWCHVMQKECFKNQEIADILNQYFIPVKVDREEHTDIDEIYMHAVIQMTGSGGWPLSVFLTPDLKPFFGGTYFPPYSVGQYPGFMDILRYIQQLWTQKREQIETTSAHFVGLIQSHLSLPSMPNEGQDYQPLFDRAILSLTQTFDKDNGGWGVEPKFPPNLTLSFLLHYAMIYNDARAKEMVEKTLTYLALSGLYDHVGGGFHRYCIDRIWHIPHFEKMLYDNAQLALIYLQYYSYTQNLFFKVIGERTLQYLLSELYTPEGGFSGSQDADSEHEEGKFYVWEYEEIKNILGKDADVFCKFFGIEPEGNWNEYTTIGKDASTRKNILDPKNAGILYNDVNTCIKKYLDFFPLISKLYSARQHREKPLRDTKCVTSWNALAISALTKASIYTTDDIYQKVAIKTAESFLHDYKQLGFLPHVLHNTKIEGFIEDYALFVIASLDIYETTLEETWIEKAIMLVERMIHQFWDEDELGFYRTSHQVRVQYPISSKPILDHQEPSGNAVSAMALARLGFLVNSEYLDMAEQLCQGYYNWIQRAPEAFPAWLDATLLLKYKPVECTVFSEGMKFFPSPLLTHTYQSRYPYFIFRKNKDIQNELQEGLAIFCHHQTCSAPVHKLNEINSIINNLINKNIE